MLAPERHHLILNRLEERGIVRTMELAEQFAVTDETIRRDLQILSDAGKLARVHGGANSLNNRFKLRSFNERTELNIEAKQAIAEASLSLIQPNRTYAFDSSTTALALVLILPNLPFRVVTNAFAVLEQLKHRDSIELISTGGRYHPKTHTFVGGDSINTLGRHQIHTAFISCIGFDIERGASEGFEEQATFKEQLILLAEEVVLLVDSSKLNQQSEYFFAPSKRISRIITDKGIHNKQADAIRGCGVKLTIAS